MALDDIDILWLASYPKSGNTWLRFFLSALIYGKSDNSAEITKNIPEIGSGSNDEAYNRSGFTLVKTHCPYKDLEPLHDRTRGFIYIVRNPLDVILSSYNYHHLQLVAPIDIPEPDYRLRFVRHFLKNGAYDIWLELGYGTLRDHVKNWTVSAAEIHPHLIIRYEDMLTTPIIVATAIDSFLKLNKTREELQAALDFASFKNMRNMEDREIKEGKKTFFTEEAIGIGHKEGKRFMNAGQANRKHLIPPGARTQANHYFQEINEKFGYC